MTPDRLDQFEADIADSPAALGRLLDAWQPVDLGAAGRVALVGLGSSRFAAEVVAPHMRARGWSAWVEIAGGEPATLPADDMTLVAISASGRTPELIATAERHRGHGRVVAVTNMPDGPLAAADHVVALDAGEETAGIACRSFRATIAVLALASGVSTVDDLRPAVERLGTVLADRRHWAPPIVEGLDGATSIDVLADGSMLGVAEQAALMLREAPRLPAHAASTADWLHTGVYLAWPGHRLVIYPGSAADEEVGATAERRGVALAGIAPGADDPIVRAIVDSVAMECVAADLWRRTSAYEIAPD